MIRSPLNPLVFKAYKLHTRKRLSLLLITCINNQVLSATSAEGCSHEKAELDYKHTPLLYVADKSSRKKL
jgi:hypothetical protein